MIERQRWMTVAGWFVASRLTIAALGVIGVATFTDQRALADCLTRTNSSSTTISPADCDGLTAQGRAAFDLETTWNKWDAKWYERIATH